MHSIAHRLTHIMHTAKAVAPVVSLSSLLLVLVLITTIVGAQT
jgi:hypothetical protein